MNTQSSWFVVVVVVVVVVAINDRNSQGQKGFFFSSSPRCESMKSFVRALVDVIFSLWKNDFSPNFQTFLKITLRGSLWKRTRGTTIPNIQWWWCSNMNTMTTLGLSQFGIFLRAIAFQAYHCSKFIHSHSTSKLQSEHEAPCVLTNLDFCKQCIQNC